MATVAAAGCAVLSGCQQQQHQQNYAGAPPQQALGGVVMIEPSKGAPEVKSEQK
ncbi:MAG: hypothetical protein IKJ29_00890 [Akkermansia sp.]|nr:hypothetical protein [Akkermansia sp.]